LKGLVELNQFLQMQGLLAATNKDLNKLVNEKKFRRIYIID
jgi:hypothetical protein